MSSVSNNLNKSARIENLKQQLLPTLKVPGKSAQVNFARHCPATALNLIAPRQIGHNYFNDSSKHCKYSPVPLSSNTDYDDDPRSFLPHTVAPRPNNCCNGKLSPLISDVNMKENSSLMVKDTSFLNNCNIVKLSLSNHVLQNGVTFAWRQRFATVQKKYYQKTIGLIGVGLVVLISGIAIACLYFSDYLPVQILGPIVLAAGLLITVFGIIWLIIVKEKLKKKEQVLRKTFSIHSPGLVSI